MFILDGGLGSVGTSLDYVLNNTEDGLLLQVQNSSGQQQIEAKQRLLVFRTQEAMRAQQYQRQQPNNDDSDSKLTEKMAKPAGG